MQALQAHSCVHTTSCLRLWPGSRPPQASESRPASTDVGRWLARRLCQQFGKGRLEVRASPLGLSDPSPPAPYTGNDWNPINPALPLLFGSLVNSSRNSPPRETIPLHGISLSRALCSLLVRVLGFTRAACSPKLPNSRLLNLSGVSRFGARRQNRVAAFRTLTQIPQIRSDRLASGELPSALGPLGPGLWADLDQSEHGGDSCRFANVGGRH